SRINTKSPWYYNSCLDCTQKPLERATDFWCFKCSKAIEKQLIRHRIELCVEDKTGTTIFTILDSEAKKLIGQDAMTLYDDHLSKVDEDDEDASPIPELLQSSFIGKEFLFKLKITNYNHDPKNRQTFTLIKIMDKSTNLDKSIIEVCESSAKKDKNSDDKFYSKRKRPNPNANDGREQCLENYAPNNISTTKK
ncbi:hypothetical protein RND81_05G192200, partial [Saponaria officinalis]